MIRTEASIIDTRPAGPDACILRFRIPLLKEQPAAGKFFLVRLLKDGFPLFGRAFAVLEYSESGTEAVAGFLIKEAGRGTAMLRAAVPGDKAILVGPSGNGFPPLEHGKRHIFVAGGTGIAAFNQLIRTGVPRAKTPGGMNPHLLYGASEKSMLYLYDELDTLPVELMITTEDGSAGEKGLVTELLDKVLNENDPSSSCVIYSCGPDMMMKSVAGIGMKKGVDTYLSLEARMACGTGLCNGCVVEVIRNGIKGYERVCHEGPVFPARVLPSFAGNKT